MTWTGEKPFDRKFAAASSSYVPTAVALNVGIDFLQSARAPGANAYLILRWLSGPKPAKVVAIKGRAIEKASKDQ